MPELALENVTAGIVVECDDEATFQADPLTDEDILAEFNHSADANVEKEEEMDEDEIVIVDEPPKPPTQCELRHAISVLNTFSFFADDVHLDNLRKSTRNISQIIVSRLQRGNKLLQIISAELSKCYIQILHDRCSVMFRFCFLSTVCFVG